MILVAQIGTTHDSEEKKLLNLLTSSYRMHDNALFKINRLLPILTPEHDAAVSFIKYLE